MSPARFEKQIKWISENYHVIAPPDLRDFEKPLLAGKKGFALITFDDGSKSILDFAVPVLRKYGLQAILFLNASPALRGGFWSGLVTYLISRDLLFADKMRKKYNGIKDVFLKITEKDVEEFSILSKLPRTSERVLRYQGEFASIEDLNSASDCLWIGNHLYDHYNAASVDSAQLMSLYNANSQVVSGMDSGMPDIFSYPFGHPGTCYNEFTDRQLIELGALKIFYANRSMNKSLAERFLFRSAVGDFYSDGYMRSLCQV